MTVYDYIVIGFYLIFMFMLGPIYKSFSKTSSDFFRGGGGMLWWVVGSSAFMTTFTAWAFTAGAAKAYETGTFFLVLFGCNILALMFCFFFVVAKYRQMRIITVMEGVRKRFGKTSEQILTWLLILTKILYGGAMLYAIAVFMACVFDVPMAILVLLLKFNPVVQWLWQDPNMTTDDVVRIIWQTADLNAREIGDLKIAITTGVVAVICVGWFFLTMFFYRKNEQPYVEQVDDFFNDMAMPIQPDEQELGGHDNESRQCAVLGNLCLVYGAFILLLVLIPNEATGRLIIFCCSSIVIGIGLALKALGRRYRIHGAGNAT